MPDPQTLAFRIVDITLLLIIALLALIYSLPILCIRRFQHRNNIFALNVCVTTVLSCLVYAGFYALPLLSIAPRQLRTASTWLLLGSALLGYSTAFNFVLVSFHRCFSILYPQKRFFQLKPWVAVCLLGQWIIASILAIPAFIDPERVSSAAHAYRFFWILVESRMAMAALLFFRDDGDHSIVHLLDVQRSDLLPRARFVSSSSNSTENDQ